MALDISNATYGRSEKGIQALKNEIYGDIKNARNKLTGTEYNEFMKVIKSSWAGADKNMFVKNFKAGVETIDKDFAAWRSKIEACFDADEAAFSKFQKSNDITSGINIK